MFSATDIYIFSLHLFMGVSLILSILMLFIWSSVRDKILGWYTLFVVACFIMSFAKAISIPNGWAPANIMENNWADEILSAVSGLIYIYFFGKAFHFDKSKKHFRFVWLATLTIMYIQIITLLVFLLAGVKNYSVQPFWMVILMGIFLFTLILLILAFFKKSKKVFEKLILTGATFFYLFVMISIYQELSSKLGKESFSFLYISFLGENIFFTIAAAVRTRQIYAETEKTKADNLKSRLEAEQVARQKETDLLEIKASNYKYQLEIEQVINFFATSISEKETIDDMLWDVAKNLIGKLGFEDCMIYLWNEDQTLLLQKAGYGIKGSMQNDANKAIYHVPKGKGIVGSVVENKQYILSNDTSLDKRYYSADGKIQLSELCVPIIHNNEAIGAINTEHSDKNFYTERHLQILITIASMLADKIDMIEAQEQTRKKEMEVLQLNTDLANSQLTALRAQMNPHFIFNALNSIQQFILQGNADEANRYLSRFSRLQREILNHSDHQFIPLEKEKEILEIYLELEQLRIKDDFEFKILVDETIDPDEVMIPPMIIQPFVENAIWHGLMPKKGNKELVIEFKPGNDEDQLLCIITDTGIGREAAAKMKQQTENTSIHKSRGLSLVYERLQILQQQLNKQFMIKFEDLRMASNEALGTKVTLTLHSR